MSYTKEDAAEDGYTDFTVQPNGQIVVINRLLYTHAILAGLDAHGYKDRWCYDSYEIAKNALSEWNGEGEPKHWHRHPGTGRRRPDGDATLEYIER
jgi:hypothetical protein